MRRAIFVYVVLLAIGLAWIAVLDGSIPTAAEEGFTPLSVLAEKIRKGEIDVGKEYGMASDRRYHKIHAEVVGLECNSCHIGKVSARMEPFAARPPVDISPEAPETVDRRVCLGCHLAGPGKDIYSP
ncbi:MAG: hypothetical protein ACUVXI_09560 [bacterium]